MRGATGIGITAPRLIPGYSKGQKVSGRDAVTWDQLSGRFMRILIAGQFILEPGTRAQARKRAATQDLAANELDK